VAAGKPEGKLTSGRLKSPGTPEKPTEGGATAAPFLAAALGAAALGAAASGASALGAAALGAAALGAAASGAAALGAAALGAATLGAGVVGPSFESRAATPGKTRPSSNSNEAPPPVEMCDIWSARPACSTAATESPPPMIVIHPYRDDVLCHTCE